MSEYGHSSVLKNFKMAGLKNKTFSAEKQLKLKATIKYLLGNQALKETIAFFFARIQPHTSKIR